MLDSSPRHSTSQNLALPPDLSFAPVSGSLIPASIDAAGSSTMTEQQAAAMPGESDFADNPSSGAAFGASNWVVRYSEGGIDAENRDGDYCSGRQDWDMPDVKRTKLIRVACSDGRTGTYMVENDASGVPTAALMFGKQREAAIVLAQ
jgi:hypothetical protein